MLVFAFAAARPDAGDVLKRFELETAPAGSGGQGDIVRMLTNRLCDANEDNVKLRDEVSELREELAALKRAIQDGVIL